MASRTIVSGLPRCLPPHPPGPAPTCVPFVEGRQRAAPHSSTFPPTEAPLQTLHMDVKREVTEVLIDWIRGARRQLSESFGLDLPVLRLHSDRGGEFSFDLQRAFYRAEGIRQTFTLPASPQQNRIVECRIGMVMDVARKSMIHAAVPYFLWPFTVQYATHQINLQPRLSLPETTPTLRWTGKVGDASVFRVLGSQAFVRDTSADKLSSRARLFPYRTFSLPPPAALPERREPESRPVLPESRPASLESRSESPVRTRVPLPSPPASSLPDGLDPESDSLRAALPTVTRFLATVVTDPLFESTAASALVAKLVDFAAACRLDCATSLVAESASASVCPPSVRGECALHTDVLEDRQEEFECFVAAVPHLVSMLLAPEGDPDAPDIPTPRSYAEAIEGSPPVFKARYVARGISQQQGVDFFQTFSPTPKMTHLWVLLHVAAHRDYELHSLDFSTTFLQGNLHEEIWLRRPPVFTGSFPAGTQWSLRRPVYGLRQAPHDLVFTTADTAALAHMNSELQKRHTCTDLGELTSYLGLHITQDSAQRTFTLTQSHMVYMVLQGFGFTYSSSQSTPLPTGHSLSAPPSDESVEPSGPYLELVGCLMYLMTFTRPDLAYPLSLFARYVAPGRHRKVHWDAAKRVLRYLCSTSGMGLVLGGRARVVLTGHADASWVDDLAMQRSSQGYTFSLGSSSVSWRSTRSSSVLSSSYWSTERSTLLCATSFSRELQQRGLLRLAYVASQANTADVFTKALQPCDHHCFCTILGLVVFTLLFVLLYITLHVNWPCGHLLVLRLRGFLYVPTCFLVQSFICSHSNMPARNRPSSALCRSLPARYRTSPARSHLSPARCSPSPGAILAAMYAIADSAEGDCYLRVPPDLGIVAVALGASAATALGASASAALGTGASAAPGAGAFPLSCTAPTESLHTFTLDSGASRSFSTDSTTLTPLSRPVAVSLADPSGGPV
ncbi:unnamed protein product, partial [Closterium sp. NIES-54]